MKKIPLGNDRFATIDDEDFEKVNEYKWHFCSGYAQNSKRGRGNMYMHRFLLDFPDGEIDHINNNSLDNRKENLRVCTHQENQRNQKLSSKNKSGFRGVSKYRNKWRAIITVLGKDVFLGYFKSPEDAAKKYDEESIKNHGVFGKTNFPH